MAKTQTTEFDNEMKALSMGVYKGNEKSIPKDWIKVSEYDKKVDSMEKHFTKMEKLLLQYEELKKRQKGLAKRY